MPRFKGGAGGLNPLALQLTASASVQAEVVGWYAAVDPPPGIATTICRPVITRPSALGTPAGTPVQLAAGVSNPSQVPACQLLSAYAIPPSFPSVSPYTTLAPFYVEWAASPGQGLIVPRNTGLLLYAIAGASAAWNAEMEWNEP